MNFYNGESFKFMSFLSKTVSLNKIKSENFAPSLNLNSKLDYLHFKIRKMVFKEEIQEFFFHHWNFL